MTHSPYQQRPQQAFAVDVARTQVLNLTQLVDELQELVQRGFDFENRDSSDTDASLCAQIQLLVHFAQKYVFCDEAAFEDERTIARLRSLMGTARRATQFLTSAAPGIQRALQAPEPDELAFMRNRVGAVRRSKARYCQIENGASGILQFLRVPGTKMTLEYVIHACTTLDQVARVLSAINLEHTNDRGGERLVSHGESIVRDRA